MRKTLWVLASLVAIFSIAGVATAQTNPLPGSGWYTTAQIQNVSTQTGDARVTLQVYPAEGASSTQVYSATTSVPQGGGKTFFPGSANTAGNIDVTPSLPGPFQGSMVVLSDREIVAVGQITNRHFPQFGVGVPGGFASEQYRGSTAVSSRLIYPTVKNNYGGKTTIFSVQAAGSPVTYVATIRSSDGKIYTKSGSISENRATILIPSDFRDASNNPMPSTNCEVGGVLDANTSPCFGAITVEATGGNIVGTVIEFRVGESPARTVQASSMFASNEAGKTILCPTYKNAFPISGNQRTTGITVANVSSSPVTFDLTLSSASGNTTIPDNTLQSGRSLTFFRHLNTGNTSLPPADTLASAVITTKDGSNSLVAVVSESNFPGTGNIPANTPQKQTTYTCFNADQATNKVAAPIFKKDAGNNTTGLQIQNANPAGGSSFAATVNFVCTQIGTTSPVNQYSLTTPVIAPGAAANVFRPSQVPDGQLCSVIITAPSTSDKVVVVVNESSDFFPGTETFLLNTKNYEGFNLP